MGVVLPPLEFTECLTDSPYFRENLHKHERELEKTNQHIKRIIKEVRDLITAAKQLGKSQRSLAQCLKGFTFECIGGTQTDDEQVICASLSNFADLINQIEDERDRMLENAHSSVVRPLEEFRKKYIGGAKLEKKKFEKQTAKFCQNQERYLNLTTKKTNSLQEADASVDMAERHFYTASMDYVYLIQEVHERKKFEFVETLLTFIYSWFTFYHQGYELKRDCDPYWKDLQTKIQKTRNNFDDFSQILRKRMSEVQKQDEPVRNAKGCREGYLFLLEKKAFGNTWTKHYCSYDKETKTFAMLPYNQLTTKTLPHPDKMAISSCVRRMSDSIEKRFCFDIQSDEKPGVIFTFQALSDQDRKCWMDIMDGKEPTYTTPSNVNKISNVEERQLDEHGIQFVKKCIEVLESRGLEEQGLYRVVGVSSKVTKLLNLGLDRRKNDRFSLDDPVEWETKTITSALKMYLRNLPEPLMTFRFHNGFIAAVKNESKQNRIRDVHALLYRLPKTNFEVLKILMKHLTNVVSKSDKNLMNVSNLGVCFGPTLLRPEEETVASILDLKFYNIVVEILIENYQRLFFDEPGALSPKYLQSATNNQTVNAFNPSNNAPSYVNYREQVAQPYTCTVSAYVDPRKTSSMYSVHESSNGLYELSPRQAPNPQRLKQLLQQNVVSQSETNLPALHNYSPPNFRPYATRLETNSTSSSNESLSSTSREGNHLIGILPKKTQRSSVYMGYPKSYKSPGYVNLHSSLVTNSTSRRGSPTFDKIRRVRTLYACMGEHDGELSFEPNQIITNVKSSPEPGWLEGTLNGKTGLIPENYVEVLP
ncbi:unnamed protein product [Phyllotreta striolata]|uniref:Rho GTPase-activating protein 26 n=1 Tax=Phyllotreta striolata TaxID=444603 RepID=A0A9N9TLZ5_PHYSR|nr:unnamed protein product [Phyllotreta striolata]